MDGQGAAADAAARVEAGGTVIAQDEATGVVWGMPGNAALAGICSAILPLGDIPTSLAERAAGKM